MLRGDKRKSSNYTFRVTRRRWLQRAGVLATATMLPVWVARAGEQSPSTLNALPRMALVIGNTNYTKTPLKNPGNDAKDIAGELQKLGFQVNLKLDVGRDEMIEAIRAFCAELGKKKGIGMFYYAGHGAQLAWNNYLIPVDAVISKLDDMQTQTVELNLLLQGLIKAHNPMNVIILDACRDNPFGNNVHSEQKGLSQFDAPPGSLLAYATSPGNAATDGDGANGLYTENLLRELKVPETKIEDVFKRVRLNVRRQSAGKQIPWESTSLEDDFYFSPPQHIKKQSEAELDKLFNEELALWEKIKKANEPGSLEDYLRENPSGRYSELAQFQLDLVLATLGEKKIELVSAPENPFSKGNARIDTRYKIGDSYSYRVIDLFTKLETNRSDIRITQTTDNQVIFNDGLMITDLFGNYRKIADGKRFSDGQFFVPEYVIGKKWSTRYKIFYPDSTTGEFELNLKVVAHEQITVPAGRFNAFRVEGNGWGRGPFGTISVKQTYWIAPDLRRPVAREDYLRLGNGRVTAYERYELTAYSQQ